MKFHSRACARRNEMLTCTRDSGYISFNVGPLMTKMNKTAKEKALGKKTSPASKPKLRSGKSLSGVRPVLNSPSLTPINLPE